jgi:CPA1 family monovalent cation:H+ antiporter
MNIYGILTILIVLTALFSYINIRFIKLPATIGVMLISLICSLFLIGLAKFYPSVMQHPISIIGKLDFETLLMRIMLTFLLFAGAIHIDSQKLKKEIAPIATYATLGILISTAVIGSSMYFLF